MTPIMIAVAKNIATSSSIIGFLCHSFPLASGWSLRYSSVGMFCFEYLVVSVCIISFTSVLKNPGCAINWCASLVSVIVIIDFKYKKIPVIIMRITVTILLVEEGAV